MALPNTLPSTSHWTAELEQRFAGQIKTDSPVEDAQVIIIGMDDITRDGVDCSLICELIVRWWHQRFLDSLLVA